MKSVIVIIGYNRPDSLERCYRSVRKAYYRTDTVDLIFSLDHSDIQEKLIALISSFDWPYGEKKIIAHEERQGLRRHVISCGDLADGYDYLIMLEDDIVVSDSFWLYTDEAVKVYGNDPSIAGISLYRHTVYPQSGRLFEPEYTGGDTFLMQAAQSWGQAWTNRQWQGFRTWYDNNQVFDQPEGMADYSYGWDQRSWLRYYMGYVAAEHKYLVYPYHSFSTNMEDAGENRKYTDTDYQVSLVRDQKEFRMFPADRLVRYDAFYERMDDDSFCCIYDGEKVLMDLNGSHSKYFGAHYLLSTRYLPYAIVKTYGLRMRPQEVNFREEIPGEDIFLYDLTKPVKKQKHGINPNVVRYDVRAVSWARLSFLGMTEFAQNLRKKRKKRRK